jgi:probable phosphoglycerate mutase
MDAIPTDDRLIEMDWGDWEGETLADLRARGGEAMAANEARGLDFRPPGGESPAEVQSRVLGWLADVAAAERDVAAVTHKGVIRVVMAKALGWDMRGKPPVRLDWTRAHVFDATPDGEPRAVGLNGDGDV